MNYARAIADNFVNDDASNEVFDQEMDLLDSDDDFREADRYIEEADTSEEESSCCRELACGAHTRAITGKRTLPAEQSSLLLMGTDLDKFSSSEEESAKSEESEVNLTNQVA